MDLEVKMPDLSKLDLDKYKKKAKKIGIYIGIGIVTLIVIITLKNMIFGKKIPYTQIETQAQKAAERYYKKHDDKLPATIGATVEVDFSTLATEKYLKPIEKMTNAKTDMCTGKVIVSNTSDTYTYTTYLKCSDYDTIKFSDKLIEETLVGEGSGLYENRNDEGEIIGYTFRGEYVDNYMTFATQTWRILGITEEGRIRLIQNEYGGRTVWDNRYNSEYKRSTGVNKFMLENMASSRLKEFYDKQYDGKKFTDAHKALIVPQSFCLKRDTTIKDPGIDNCTDYMYKNQTITAIRQEEFGAASIDNTCKINPSACRNYNYLSVGSKEYWTISPDPETSSKVFFISTRPYTAEANSTKYTKMVIEIDANVAFKSGKGTLAEPYTIKS